MSMSPKRFELVMHARELAFDVLFRVRESFPDPRDVEIHAAMRCPPPFFDFAHDAARNVIASQQLRRAAGVLVALRITPALFLIISRLSFVVIGDEIEHETFAVGVCKNSAFAADAFGHKHSAPR